MLRLSTLEQSLDSASRNLTRKFPAHAAHIAAVGLRIHERLGEAAGETQTLSSPAKLFDICTMLETDSDLAVHADLREMADAHRRDALHATLDAHYDESLKQEPHKARDIERERSIVFMLAEESPRWRKELPPGRFGPDTLRELLAQESYESLQEYVYVLENDGPDWSRLSALLPRDLRERFDAEENGIEIPDVMDAESASDVLRAISEHKSIPMRNLLDPAHFVEHWKRIPAFSAVMQFYAAHDREREESGQKAPPESSSPS